MLKFIPAFYLSLFWIILFCCILEGSIKLCTGISPLGTADPFAVCGTFGSLLLTLNNVSVPGHYFSVMSFVVTQIQMKRSLRWDKVIVRNYFLLELLLPIYMYYIYVIYQYSPPVFFMSTCNKSFLYTLYIYCHVLLQEWLREVTLISF